MDKNYIHERLLKISSSVEREIFRDVSKVFAEVCDYSLVQYKLLEQRLDMEIKDSFQKFYIYTTVSHKNDINPMNDFLFPVIDPASSYTPGILATYFLECDKDVIDIMLGKSFKAYVTTDKRSYSISVRLVICKRYLDKIKWLYNEFYHNKIKWHNINFPYLYKFVDVVVESKHSFIDSENIMSVDVDWNDYKKIVKQDIIPKWNINVLELQCSAFPTPVRGSINYQHSIAITNNDNGYVVESSVNIKSVFFRDKELIITTTVKENREWNIISIISPINKDIENDSFPIVSNNRFMSHMDRQAENFSGSVLTKAEVNRIFNSYLLSENVELASFELLSSSSFSLDSEFILCELGREVPLPNQFLKFYFRVLKYDFTTKEQLCFLLAEMALFFPQYRCVGELV